MGSPTAVTGRNHLYLYIVIYDVIMPETYVPLCAITKLVLISTNQLTNEERHMLRFIYLYVLTDVL